jgi:hypothetical protein
MAVSLPRNCHSFSSWYQQPTRGLIGNLSPDVVTGCIVFSIVEKKNNDE